MLWNQFRFENKPVKEMFIVTILYKSGNQFTFRCSKFSVNRGQWEWVNEPNKKYPHKPMVMGVDNIEAVWYRLEK